VILSRYFLQMWDICKIRSVMSSNRLTDEPEVQGDEDYDLFLFYHKKVSTPICLYIYHPFKLSELSNSERDTIRSTFTRKSSRTMTPATGPASAAPEIMSGYSDQQIMLSGGGGTLSGDVLVFQPFIFPLMRIRFLRASSVKTTRVRSATNDN
jgi:hypothetical protein